MLREMRSIDYFEQSDLTSTIHEELSSDASIRNWRES
jgi:hypothetical protein